MTLNLLIEQIRNGVQYGVMGLINLEHGSLYKAGAFACAAVAATTGSFWLGLAASLACALVGTIQSVQVGMGEPVMILSFVIIVIGGIGSIKGALVGGLLVGLADTLGRFLLPIAFASIMDAASAKSVRSSLASMLIYVPRAAVLVVRPRGLYGARS